jgi:uncharacterized membrane protein
MKQTTQENRVLFLLIVCGVIAGMAALFMVGFNYVAKYWWKSVHPDFDVESFVDINYGVSLVSILMISLLSKSVILVPTTQCHAILTSSK